MAKWGSKLKIRISTRKNDLRYLNFLSKCLILKIWISFGNFSPTQFSKNWLKNFKISRKNKHFWNFQFSGFWPEKQKFDIICPRYFQNCRNFSEFQQFFFKIRNFRIFQELSLRSTIRRWYHCGPSWYEARRYGRTGWYVFVFGRSSLYAMFV